jgi:hypothetical protein
MRVVTPEATMDLTYTPWYVPPPLRSRSITPSATEHSGHLFAAPSGCDPEVYGVDRSGYQDHGIRGSRRHVRRFAIAVQTRQNNEVLLDRSAHKDSRGEMVNAGIRQAKDAPGPDRAIGRLGRSNVGMICRKVGWNATRASCRSVPQAELAARLGATEGAVQVASTASADATATSSARHQPRSTAPNPREGWWSPSELTQSL